MGCLKKINESDGGSKGYNCIFVFHNLKSIKMERKEALTKITQVHVSGLWGRKDIFWNNVDSNVNILVGPNGSGKSTFIRLINALLTGEKKELDKLNTIVLIRFTDEDSMEYSSKKIILSDKLTNHPVEVEYINTFDVPTSKKSDQSLLLQELNKVIYEHKKDNFSFFDYRMKIINFPDEKDKIEHRIGMLFRIIDSFFSSTGKRIDINRNTNKMVFTFCDGNEEIGPDELSSGEKQLLLILLITFLKEDSPFILLMDEPELSLHIEWQSKLIESIQQLNANCQIILSTHSPSIFADGWGDKLVFMEDIVRNSKKDNDTH